MAGLGTMEAISAVLGVVICALLGFYPWGYTLLFIIIMMGLIIGGMDNFLIVSIVIGVQVCMIFGLLPNWIEFLIAILAILLMVLGIRGRQNATDAPMEVEEGD